MKDAYLRNEQLFPYWEQTWLSMMGFNESLKKEVGKPWLHVQPSLAFHNKDIYRSHTLMEGQEVLGVYESRGHCAVQYEWVKSRGEGNWIKSTEPVPGKYHAYNFFGFVKLANLIML